MVACMTIALLFSLVTWYVLIQSPRLNFACTRKLFNLSAEAIINVRKGRLCAIFLPKIKQTPFFVDWSKNLHFWRETKISWRWHWRGLLSRQALFQQRAMCISWRLYNSSEIHLRLCKMWSLVLHSQSSFYVTTTRKDNKNRQNTFFLC